MKLVILGGSGSGKSTQAHRLCKYFDVPLISTGEILREAISDDNSVNGYGEIPDLIRYAKPYVEKGELVPDEIMIEFIKIRLNQEDTDCGWILEGYPRTAFQAEELDFLLESLGQKLDWAIYLQVAEAVMVSRSLGRSLPDDQPEIVQRRVELFYDRTIPILEYYDRRRRLLTINGDNPPEQVQYNILSLLG
ncbi:nucleoside monophosphate kinase [Sphaerospermopsis aphanizomenoides BCCUSP55]|uniref:adenylate kinase family protein n=1 Tax=Sphaerospermopsis aphanizomenoides TaxID=459663 RepID=UPI000AF1DBA6|nr:nucleoside monophosphate kinase [Sphaerospermopsis aphanizomenoides]MBK1986864.1 nucleoside monophosphate kinase [Sphaerospermopsis aphanizomenoides BCCUSP55]